MSMNYDLDLQRGIDLLVLRYGMTEARSDDEYMLQLFSGDEGAAIEGLRIYAERKGEYFDKQRKKPMARCEFRMIDGHAVVDLIHVYDNKEAQLQREKFVEHKKNRMHRNGGFY